MTYLNEDRILDFLDGRLGSGDEEELLHTLAVSPERRQVLHEHLRLREITTTLSSHERFSVPEHLTSQLFMTLGAMGFTAPASTEEILTRAPQFVHVPEEAQTAAGLFGTGWRLGFTSLVTASVMSFLLGVGAIYVFGSRLGIHTLSQQKALASLHTKLPVGNVVHSEFNMASAASIPSTPVFDVPASESVADIPVRAEASLGDIAELVPTPEITDVPLAWTAPRERNLSMSTRIPHIQSPNIPPEWGIAMTSPLLNEQGIITFRYGSGPAVNGAGGNWTSPNSPTAQWTSLSELKFTWHLWKYITARASMGELASYERMPNTPPVQVGMHKYELTTSLMKSMSTVIGGELGVTLDPLGIPLEVSAGMMTDGATRLYMRGGIFAHFEPFSAMSVSAGIEGIQYSHDVGKAIKDNRAAYQNYGIVPAAAGTPTIETAGFVGPSIEIGWHF